MHPDEPARILVEADGALSAIPGAARRIPALIIERRIAGRPPLITIYCHPAEVYTLGGTFYVRRAKRPGQAAHTVVIDAAAAGAEVEETVLEGEPAMRILFEQ